MNYEKMIQFVSEHLDVSIEEATQLLNTLSSYGVKPALMT
jgi:hypothetical protein